MLEIVSAQTGYPPDMLDLDLDLEADLGIDTVKQAETFAAIREEYDIERDDNLALRDYPTLAPRHRLRPRHAPPDLARAHRGTRRRSPRHQPLRRPAPAAAAPAGADPVADTVLEIVAAQTGYPPDMLDLDLDLEADLGIDTVKQAETFAAIRDEYDIERDDNLALRDYPTLNARHRLRPRHAPRTSPDPPRHPPAAADGGQPLRRLQTRCGGRAGCAALTR